VCSLKANGWTVIRNQSSIRHSTAEGGALELVVESKAVPEAAPATKAESSWDLDDDSDDDGADIDLNALLAARDETLTATSKKSSSASHTNKHEAEDTKSSTVSAAAVGAVSQAATLTMERHFPPVVIDTINEP